MHSGFGSRNDEYKDKPKKSKKKLEKTSFTSWKKNIELFAHMRLNWFFWTLDIDILFSLCLVLAKQIANRIE